MSERIRIRTKEFDGQTTISPVLTEGTWAIHQTPTGKPNSRIRPDGSRFVRADQVRVDDISVEQGLKVVNVQLRPHEVKLVFKTGEWKVQPHRNIKVRRDQ